MEILEHGKNIMTFSCPDCGCVFRAVPRRYMDLPTNEVSKCIPTLLVGRKGVVCPECERFITEIFSKENMESVKENKRKRD